MTRSGPAPGARTAGELLERLERLLAHPANLASEEWLLVATLLVEAAEAIGGSQPERKVRNGRFDSIMAELRDLTDDFTSPAFLRSTRAARRKNPALFV